MYYCEYVFKIYRVWLHCYLNGWDKEQTNTIIDVGHGSAPTISIKRGGNN